MGSKGTPAFMSFKALLGDGHVHSLNDDLESFIYVVLYAALRWLPVESSYLLNWWMTEFFSAPRPDGTHGGAVHKMGSAIFRVATSTLRSTTSHRVVYWLKAAMDLHYKGGSPNPVWNDGKELKKLWEEVLAAELPSDDWFANPMPGIKTGNNHATHTSATSTQVLYGSRNESPHPPTPTKRSRAHSTDSSVPPPSPKPAKRSRSGRQPQAGSTSVGNRRDEDLMTGIDSTTMSLGSTSALSSEESTRSSPRSTSRGRS